MNYFSHLAQRLVRLLLFFSVSVFDLNGQVAPSILWQRTLGTNSSDYFSAILQTTDGGYALDGDTPQNHDFKKMDALGNNEWDATVAIQKITCMQQTSDSGFVVGGHTEYNYLNYDYRVVKLDAAGNLTWSKTIGGSADDFLYSIQQTADGGYILGGNSISPISGNKTENSLGGHDFWVIKLDASGIIVWQNTIGSSDDDRCYAIQQTTDGGYIVGGYSSGNISGDKTENSMGSTDYWVVKLDASGNITWQNTIGGSSYDSFHALQQTTDGGYILGGYSASSISGDKTENSFNYSADYWVVKLDATGNILWQNTIGGNNSDLLYSLHQTSDGGYILGGTSVSNISGDKTQNCKGLEDYWVVKLNSSGTVTWQKTIGGSDSDYMQHYAVRQTSDQGFILGGTSVSNISGDKNQNRIGQYDFWVMKLGPESTFSLKMSNTKPTCAATPTGSGKAVPSPAGTYTYLWSNGATTQTMSNAIAGYYQVTVTKTSTGSTAVGSTNIPDPAPLTLSLKATGITCFGMTNGSIKATVGGGTGSKTLLWSNGTTVATISNLPAGTYSITATDTKGCTISDSYTMIEPAAVELTHTELLLSNGTYRVTLFSTGGVPYGSGQPRRYCKVSATNTCTFSGTYIFNNLAPGSTITFRVRDFNNCQDEITVTLPSSKPSFDRDGDADFSENLAAAKNIRAAPNPFGENLTLTQNFSKNENPGLQNGQKVQIFNQTGQLVLEKDWVAGLDIFKIENTAGWPAGFYFVKITDGENGTPTMLRLVKI